MGFPCDLLTPAFQADPHRHYRVWRKEWGIAEFPRHGAWVVIDYDLAVAVLKDAERFSSALFKPYSSGSLHGADPPEHTMVRKRVAPFFSPQRSSTAAASIARIVGAAITRMKREGSISLLADFAELVPFRVACDWLGLDDEVAKSLVTQAPQSIEWAQVQPAVRATGLIADLERTRTMNESQLAELTGLFMMAVVTTTRDFIWMALRALSANPAAVADAIERPESTGALVDELLRLEPPLHALVRSTRCEVDLAGSRIPANSVIWVSIAAANRDPRRFDSPDEILISRTGTRHISFGHGPHFCLGNHLGKMISEAALRAVLPVLRHSSFFGSAPALEFAPNDGLPIIWHPVEWRVDAIS